MEYSTKFGLICLGVLILLALMNYFGMNTAAPAIPMAAGFIIYTTPLKRIIIKDIKKDKEETMVWGQLYVFIAIFTFVYSMIVMPFV